MFFLLDPILFSVKYDHWAGLFEKYENLMINFLSYLREIDKFELQIGLRYDLFKIPILDGFYDLIFRYNPFRNYPPHYKNVFRPYIVEELFRRKIFLEVQNPEEDPQSKFVANHYVPEESLHYCNILIYNVNEATKTFSFITSETEIASSLYFSPFFPVYIEKRDVRISASLRSCNIDDILIEYRSDLDFALKAAVTIFAIQTNRLIDLSMAVDFVSIIFSQEFLRNLRNQGNFFEQDRVYRNRVVETITCILYDRNNSSINLHRVRGGQAGLYIAYVFQNKRTAPDGRCSRINFRFEHGSFYFAYYNADAH